MQGTSLWTGKSSTGVPESAQLAGYIFFVNGADKDTPWKCRVSTTTLVEMTWGLSVPTFSATVARLAVAGNLTQVEGELQQGTSDDPYEYLFSYYRTTDGAESAVTTTAKSTNEVFADEQIRLSGLTSHADSTVHIRIYRKNPSGTTYRRVSTATYDVANGVTTYDDNAAELLQSAYTAAPSAADTVAIPKADSVVSYGGVLWLLGLYNDGLNTTYPETGVRRDMFALTKAGEPHFAPTTLRQAVPTHVGKIVGGYGHPSGMLILCERGTLKVQGITTTTLEIQQRGLSMGCVARRTIQAIDMPDSGTALVWLSHRQVTLFNGLDMDSISDGIGPTLALFLETDLSSSWAEVDAANGIYRLHIKDTNKVVSRTGWARLDWHYGQAGRPWAMGEGPGTGTCGVNWRSQTYGDLRIFGDEEGQLHKWDDDTLAFSARGWDHDLAGTIAGTVTSATANTLTDSTATFYTADSGLAGVWVMVVHANGDREYRKISSNTGAQLTVSANWTSTPTTTAKYYLGGIDVWIKTPHMNLGDDTIEKRVFWAAAAMNSTAASGDTVSLTPYFDYSSTAGTGATFDATQKYQRKSMTGRFRQVQLLLQHTGNSSRLNVRGVTLSILPALEARKP